MQIRTAVAIAGLLLLVRGAASQPPPPGSPLANREHPRIWATPGTLPALRAKVSPGGDFAVEFQAWVSFLDSQYDTAASDPRVWSDEHAMNFAYVSVLGPIPGIAYGHSMSQYISKAKECLLRVVTSSSTIGNNGNYGVPVAYDWLYPHLSAGERAQLVDFMKTSSQTPWINQADIRNPFVTQDISARSVYFLSGVAFFGDGIDDAWASTAVSAYTTLFSGGTGALDSADWWAGNDGGWGQGFSYAHEEGMIPLLMAVEAWRTSHGRGLSETYAGATVFRYYPKWQAYLIRPHAVEAPGEPGGRRWVVWRTQAMAADARPSSSPNRTILAALRLYASIDPDMAALAQFLGSYRAGPPALDGAGALFEPLLGNFILGQRVIPKDPTALNLPVTKHQRSNEFTFMRTGWGLDDTMVAFIASPFTRMNTPAYTSTDNGSFTIDRKGPLVIRGGYQIHDSYPNSSWSANILTFVDTTIAPGEGSFQLDRGAQRIVWDDINGYAVLTEGSQWDQRDNLKFLPHDAVDRDVDYVAADLTRAYNGSVSQDRFNEAKITRYTRQLVYFRPAQPGVDVDRVVVFDRATSTNTKFEKRWLLHTGPDPMINGTETAGVPLRGGTGARKWTYTGADLITATNTATGAAGKLFCRILLPASRTVVKVGGPNHDFEDPYGQPQPGNPVPSQFKEYVGNYRVEVIPASRNLEDTFLHVLEATDAGVVSPTPTALLSGSEMVAARVGNRIAAFGRTAATVISGDFVVDQPGNYRVHISDLHPRGEYEVAGIRTVASEGGTVYIPISVSTGGFRLLVRLTSLPPSPSAPTGLRIITSQ